MGDAILRIPRDARVRAYRTRDTYCGVVPATSKRQPYCHSSYIELYGAPFSHLFTELKISPIEVHISAIQLQISPIHLKISSNQLEISTIKPIWRYLQLIWRYLQMNWRYLQIGRIWRYLQFIWRYLQIDKSDTISAPRRKNHCAMIQVNGLIKSCRPLYKKYTLLLIIFWIIIIIDTSVKEVFDTTTHSRIGDNTLLRRIISDTPGGYS